MTPITFLLLLPLLLFTPHSSSRRILHQPFFPATDPPPPPPPSTTTTTTQPPSSSPSPQPKYPFSSQPQPPPHHHHFFPSSTTPTTVPSTSLPTFPANISSITTTTTLPPPPPSKSHLSKKLLFLSLSLSLLSIAFIAAVAATLLYHRNHHHHQPPSSDSLRLFPPNLPTSDKPPPPPPTLSDTFSTPSSEFLYLGTLLSPTHDHKQPPNAATMDSPELRPLPPLPRHGFRDHHGGSSTDDNEFYSPKGFEDMQPQNYFHGRSSKLPPPPPPPAPPMPPPGLSETHFPARNEGRKEEGLKPKLKGLHWDKVRASSEKETVWDQLKSSSFRLNEEMMERLFMASSSTKGDQATGDADTNRVLEPHKSTNIAILLRAFNLTIDEVCQSILQGNVDTLGSELLGSLLKMAPTMEEEDKLKQFNDASPFKLCPAERFLKRVIDIPFAFKRVDAMLYISNFDAEIDYLNRSFETIQSACQQLRNNRMFMKLLEAALKAGNRMNVGTNRGDAHAFKLDTLLKLVDVKGTDGKTTLLHFVVQEIIRAEGCRLSGAHHDLMTQINPQTELCDEVEFRKRGLEVVSSLGGELSSVKKAATMDSDLLSKEVGRLAAGMTKVREAVAFDGQSGSNQRFSDSMITFMKKAEDDLIKIEAKERRSISTVKETTEYFHGNSSMEEAQPLRIFMVVHDFLTVLDQVCKEVGKINERTTIGMPMSQTLPSVFPWFNGRRPFDGEDNPTSD